MTFVRERNSGIYGFSVLLDFINFYSLSRFHHISTATRLFTFPRTTSRDHVRHHFPEAKETKLHSMKEEQNLHAN